MSRRMLPTLVLCLSLLTARATFAQGGASPQITFEEAAVVASGLTPGKTMVWFGIEHVIDAEYSGDITQYCHEATVASDGTARLELPRDVVTRSLWLAVDLDTGGYALAAPAEYRIAPLPAAPQLVRPAGAPDLLVVRANYVLGLLVRPGAGAWTFAGSDGGDSDADGLSDGILSLAVNQASALPGASTAPDRVNSADLSFLVDPVPMQITVLKGGVAQ